MNENLVACVAIVCLTLIVLAGLLSSMAVKPSRVRVTVEVEPGDRMAQVMKPGTYTVEGQANGHAATIQYEAPKGEGR